MKRLIFTAILLLVCGAAMAQDAGLTATSHADLENWDRSKNRRYNAYTAKDGHTYRLEDKLTFGSTSDGKTYRYMWERVNALHILGEVPPMPISGKLAGRTGVIKNIIVNGNKKTGHVVTVVLAVGGASRVEVRPFEMALESQEIISQGMTKDAALKELKEAKDMLDLGLITKEQFEAKKAELSQYIIGK